MKYDIIATGSEGNAVIINDSVLIDCGVPFVAIKPYIKDLKLVLLTHKHGDHFRPATIRRLSEARPSLRWGVPPWLLERMTTLVIPNVIDIVNPGSTLVYGLGKDEESGKFTFAKIRAESTFHDAPNCCYHISICGKDVERLFYATDTSSLDGISAKNYDLYMIEANYDDAEIMERIAEKKNMGEYAYEERVLRTHLSKAKADDFIYRNIGEKGEYVYLHRHIDRTEEQNNDGV